MTGFKFKKTRRTFGILPEYLREIKHAAAWRVFLDEAGVEPINNWGEQVLCYSNPLSTGRGAISYHVVYDKPAYELDALDGRTRQNIAMVLSQQEEP
jgi:hypothetical protein